MSIGFFRIDIENIKTQYLKQTKINVNRKLTTIFHADIAKRCSERYNRYRCDLTDDDAGDCYTKEVGNSCGECPIQETGRQVTVLNVV